MKNILIIALIGAFMGTASIVAAPLPEPLPELKTSTEMFVPAQVYLADAPAYDAAAFVVVAEVPEVQVYTAAVPVHDLQYTNEHRRQHYEDSFKEADAAFNILYNDGLQELTPLPDKELEALLPGRMRLQRK